MTTIQNHSQLSSLKSQHNTARVELERYKLLVDSVTDYAIFLLDTKGHIMSWNKGAQRNKGYTEEEILGQHFSAFYMQKDIDDQKPERELQLAMKHGRVEDEDWRVRKDGSRFWANVVITALYDEKVGHIGFAKVTRDLTERKQHEDNLRRANTLLKAQQQELQQLNVSKDEFVSLVSHQLRTPATGTKQLLGLLAEGFSGDIASEQLGIIQRAYQSNERQIAIVDKLLQVAKLDAGHIVLRQQPVNLANVLSGIINDQAKTFDDRNQQAVLEANDDTIQIDGDPEYLRMALENLIDNASKYTPEGGKIQVSLLQTATHAKVAIKDSGIGISKEDQSKLFIRFGRIANDLSDTVGGTGLGLYWASRMIQMHNGRIKVDSATGNGTTFTVSLPLGASHA